MQRINYVVPFSESLRFSAYVFEFSRSAEILGFSVSREIFSLRRSLHFASTTRLHFRWGTRAQY